MIKEGKELPIETASHTVFLSNATMDGTSNSRRHRPLRREV